MNIMLVENDSTTGAILTDRLRAMGHVVEWAVNGNCIVVKLPMFPFTEVIVADYRLNDGDCLSFIRQAKEKCEAIADVPVILVTATLGSEIKSFESDHVFRHILKPIDLGDLEQTLKEVAAVRASRPKPPSWPGPGMAI